MKAPDIKVLEEAFFAIYFDSKGDPIHVEGPNGPAKSVSDVDPQDGNIKTIEIKLLSYDPDEDNCCGFVGNEWKCWC